MAMYIAGYAPTMDVLGKDYINILGAGFLSA